MNRLWPLLWIVFSATLCAQTTPAPARVAGFKPGETAPALSAQEWVKGAPIPRFEPGKVYLVEFWAVWCGPCIGNIPHLNALQKKHAQDGLVVIGYTNPDLEAGYTGTRKEGNTLQQVRDFVAARGDGMAYHIAYDTPDKAGYKAWMNTIGGIPHAFLIGRDGKLAVNFHPFYLDEAIEQVLAGTWDSTTGPQRLRANANLYYQLIAAPTPEKFWPIYDELAAAAPFLARKVAGHKLPFDLRRGILTETEATVASLIARAHETQDGSSLARLVVSLLRPVGEFKPKDIPADAPADLRARLEEQNRSGLIRSNEARLVPRLPLALADRMARAAYEISGKESASLSAMAEVAHLRTDPAAAVDFQTRAVAVASAWTQEREKLRLAEFARAAAAR